MSIETLAHMGDNEEYISPVGKLPSDRGIDVFTAEEQYLASVSRITMKLAALVGTKLNRISPDDMHLVSRAVDAVCSTYIKNTHAKQTFLLAYEVETEQAEYARRFLSFLADGAHNVPGKIAIFLQRDILDMYKYLNPRPKKRG